MLFMMLLDWIFQVMNISYLSAGGGGDIRTMHFVKEHTCSDPRVSDPCQNRWVSCWNRFVTYAV